MTVVQNFNNKVRLEAVVLKNLEIPIQKNKLEIEVLNLDIPKIKIENIK